VKGTPRASEREVMRDLDFTHILGGEMINQDIIRHIIYTVYNAAINGMQIIDWIPAQNATMMYMEVLFI